MKNRFASIVLETVFAASKYPNAFAADTDFEVVSIIAVGNN